MPGDRDLAQVGAHGFLKLNMLLEPRRQLRIFPSDVHCRSDLRVIHVRRPGPVEEQHLFSFVAIHEAFLMLLSELTVCLRRALSWAIPREILDFTVPNGNFISPAISLWDLAR